MWARVVKIIASLPFLIVLGIYVAYLLAGFFLVDPIAKKVLPWVGETRLASKLTAASVQFNPFTLEATVSDLKLAEPDGAPLASFARLYVDLETSGLFKWAWRVRNVQLDRPRATITVRKGGKLNWSALIAKLQEDKEPPSDTIPRVLVERVRIDNGDIEYTDANRPGKPFKLVLEPLSVELDGLSTLPEDRGDYVIAAKLPEQGGVLRWKGDVGLNPVASRGTLALEGVRLARLQRVVKSPRNYDVPSGELAAGLDYRFALVQQPGAQADADADVPWLRITRAHLELKDLAVAPKGGGAPVLQLVAARVADASFDLFSRQVDVAAVRLTGARLNASRDARGRLDWVTLFAPDDDLAPAAPAEREAAPPTPAWKVAVREIGLDDWALSYTDQAYARPLGVVARGFGLSAALHGEIGATTAIEVGPVAAQVGPVELRSGGERAAALERIALVNGRVSLADRRATIDAVTLSGLATEVVLDRDRSLNWAKILEPAPGAGAGGAESKAAEGAPFTVELARLAVDGIAVGIVDRSPRRPVRLDLERGHVTLKDLSLDLDKALPLEAGFALRQGGRFEASGSVVPGKASGRVDVRLTGLALPAFAPYVNEFARLNLRSGTASTRGRVSFSQARSGMRVDYRGSFAADDLAITEEETEEAFLGWNRLSSDSLRFGLNPDRLTMAELVARHPFGKVIIFEDKSVNLQGILRKPAAGQKTARATPAKQQESPLFPLTIERLRIVGANAEFADLSLTPQFGTRMHDLSGVVAGLATDPSKIALVELDGKVDDFGSARVRGSIKPFRATDFTDLTLTFRNLEMANLTPYSGKFAGREIESGKLSAELEYKIEDRQLAGENSFVIDSLKLGERVDSPDAMNLPLDLAIALLEDSNGIIDLDLPISGSLDDPQFSYGKIVWKAVVNVLTKLVTAPFRALGSLLGISAEKLEAVEFEYGAKTLAPPEQETLKEIGEAMAKRPRLTISVAPAFETEGDTRAIRRFWIRRDVAVRMGLTVEPDQEPGPVDVANERAQAALEELYDERFAKSGGVRALRLELEKAQKAEKPKTTDTTEKSDKRETDAQAKPRLHAEMLERLTRQIPVTEAELRRLAQARGEAVKQTLVRLGRVAPERISVDAAVEQKDSKKGVAAKLSLGASPKPAAAPATAPAKPPAAPASSSSTSG